jgi:hypothetical protein
MSRLIGGGNAVLLLLTTMAIGGALLIAFVAWTKKNFHVARTFAGGAGILIVAYFAGVITASAASSEETIAQGNTKWFCGFYLDCHLGMSVEGSETLASLPTPAGELKPKGVFHVVAVRLHNSARNPKIDMLLYQPRARIVDAFGNSYERSKTAEAALSPNERPPALGTETKVSHTPVDATLVFDLPANIQNPRMLVTEGWIVDRVLELALIADENSILHKRAFFEIEDANRTASSTAQ